jgi:hypothetical protein
VDALAGRIEEGAFQVDAEHARNAGGDRFRDRVDRLPHDRAAVADQRRQEAGGAEAAVGGAMRLIASAVGASLRSTPPPPFTWASMKPGASTAPGEAGGVRDTVGRDKIDDAVVLDHRGRIGVESLAVENLIGGDGGGCCHGSVSPVRENGLPEHVAAPSPSGKAGWGFAPEARALHPPRLRPGPMPLRGARHPALPWREGEAPLAALRCARPHGVPPKV